MRKKYLALVVGRLEGEGVVDQPMQGGKPARWAVLCAEESLSIFKDAVGGACATKLE